MAHTGEINSLKQAFGIRSNELISLVGAGGKTTLMFALAGELIASTGLVITTSTTKLLPPSSSDTPCLHISSEEREIMDFILNKGTEFGHITLTSKKIHSSDKLRGLDPELISRLSSLGLVNYTIVEADGAAGKPLKAPDIEFEPVIPQNSSLIIPVVGVDALGCPLKEEHVFRSRIVTGLTGTQPGETVSIDTIATLVTHPSGMAYGSPTHARVVPFINKTEIHRGLSRARELAHRILDTQHPQIDRVVLGHARLRPPVSEVIT
ncbi:MAG: putative selenium-dependent hydroxylase accessory protein YqeC [Deltaproteobacteria bacterium]|nr:putative selenium-dependent hydroxylase accessory protein YqeC [Deltaproteobacteria bacterium]